MIRGGDKRCQHDVGHTMAGECLGCGARLVGTTTEGAVHVDRDTEPRATAEAVYAALQAIQGVLLDDRLELTVPDLADLERGSRVLIDVVDRLLELDR
jgi:hypothetical protein